MPETMKTIIVGAGHAGLSVSCPLSKAGHGHLVLERGEIAETWRSQRWDSFRRNVSAPCIFYDLEIYVCAGKACSVFTVAADYFA